MKKIQPFVKRHILWVGLVAALLPLVCLLGLQYGSLLRLEKTSTAESEIIMNNFLMDVQGKIKHFYKNQANETLTTSAYALSDEGQKNGKHHFSKCEVEGARKLFVAVFNGKNNPKILFFSATDSAKPVDGASEETRTINLAIAPYKLLSEEGNEVRSPMLSSYDHDPNNRILLKMITNSDRKVVGVAGMILDADYLKTVILPQTIQETFAKYYSDEAQKDVIVAAYNNTGQTVFTSQNVKGQDDYRKVYLPYFGDWKISIRSNQMTPAQWASWNFKFNIAISALLTLALVGGIVLALKMAAREVRLSQMKADFVSNVSHELRTPLASIRVFGEFMKLGRVKDDAKIREYGEYIETESRRLTQLINNILDFSRIESGRKTYAFERADLGAVVSATLKIHEVQLRQNGFALDFENPMTNLPEVEIDADAISQVFVNLLDNAVKYSGDSKKIRVALGQRDGFVTVAVTDYGIGIPREEQSKIFEKFYRVSTGLIHDVKGSGLGLSLVKHIVAAHRGKVTVESEPGKGSAFTIHLPVTESVEEAKPKQEKPTLGGKELRLEYKQ
jgi:signal transduction histidine kinase